MELLELAREHLEYWRGQGIGATLEVDLSKNDLEALAKHLKQSAKEMFELEYKPIRTAEDFEDFIIYGISLPPLDIEDVELPESYADMKEAFDEDQRNG